MTASTLVFGVLTFVVVGLIVLSSIRAARAAVIDSRIASLNVGIGVILDRLIDIGKDTREVAAYAARCDEAEKADAEAAAREAAEEGAPAALRTMGRCGPPS